MTDPDNFPQFVYEISMGEKIGLTLHDLPEILHISTLFSEASALVNWGGKFTVFLLMFDLMMLKMIPEIPGRTGFYMPGDTNKLTI